MGERRGDPTARNRPQAVGASPIHPGDRGRSSKKVSASCRRIKEKPEVSRRPVAFVRHFLPRYVALLADHCSFQSQSSITKHANWLPVSSITSSTLISIMRMIWSYAFS